MPAALDVDWSAVKTHCIAHGVPDAAKRYGITQESIRQRCHREGWKDNPAVAEALVRPVTVSRPTQKLPGEIMAESIKDKLLRTRANHTETALIASAEMLTMAEETPSLLRDPEVAGVLLSHTKQAALVGGWNAQTPTAKVSLGAVGSEPLTMEAELVTEDVASTDVGDY